MNTLQWIKLKRDFEEERCILMIGPNLASVEKDGKRAPMVDELAASLADILDMEKVDYDQKARKNLTYIALRFLSIKGARRVDLGDIAKDFIQQKSKKIPEIYDWLAKLPFHIIINTNKDDYIQKALVANGKQPLAHYYNFRRETNTRLDFEKVSAETPLVYNLFGSIEESESLVLTEEDQLEFIRNVVKDDPRIPEEILGQFDDRKTYLFLGFDLENWQFRLLLDGLQLREENTTLSPKVDRFPLSMMTRTFYEERFNFQFIDQNAIDFLGELKGKVFPVADEKSKENKKVFLLYDKKEEAVKDALEDSLSQLVQNGEITIHYPGSFVAGTDESEIEQQFRNSDIVLAIVSPNFLANVALSETWLAKADELEKQEEIILRPLIARPCDWRENPILRTRIALPENNEAISSTHWNTVDDAYFDIVQSFKKLLK